MTFRFDTARGAVASRAFLLRSGAQMVSFSLQGAQTSGACGSRLGH
jgi:hypothetical protein